MPLTRGSVVGYDADRMSFKFTMMNGAQAIKCQVSDAALDDLAGLRKGKTTDRAVQFAEHRDEIEKLASDQFDNEGNGQFAPEIRIFAKDIR